MVKSLHAQSKRIAYPIDTDYLGTDEEFFCSMMYEPYLEVEDAKECIVWFVEEAVEAILELHKEHIAHLDIRRENFCIDDDSNRSEID